MNKNFYGILSLLALLTSCNFTLSTSNSSSSNNESSNNDVYYIEISKGEYNETEDSLEGVDSKDLSLLKEAFDNISNNYTSNSQVYFNKSAVERVNKLYNTTFVQKHSKFYTEKYTYFANDDAINEIGYLVKDDQIYSYKLKGSTLFEKFNCLLSNEDFAISTNESIYEGSINLSILNSQYIDTYGPTTVKYSSSYSVDYEGWSRISNNKYKCDRVEVNKDFANLLIPGFEHEENFMNGYMTFKYVTVELLENDAIRLRLYANSTQIGKLIEEHLDKDKPNWYLLFVETTISDINKTKINAVEDYIKQ